MNETVGVREAAKKSDVRAPKDHPAERLGRMLDPAVLGGLTIDLVAQLGRGSMTIDELAGLGSGEVVRLDTPLNGVIDLTLNGTLVARGEIVAVDDQFGIRVTEILVRSR
ncbi:MAG: FliM/FliN family flagellar motor switch protein [Novosphingobium sp.]